MKLFVILIFTLVSVGVSGQSHGYQFEKYGSGKMAKFKKAKIDYKSNRTARLYRTMITEGYANADSIDFAGFYVTCFWGCGTGCMSGAMVDVRDGKVYDLPLGEERYHIGCDFDDDDDCCMSFSDDSRLFISQICVETSDNNSENIHRKKYFIYLWNEQAKRFDFIESKTVLKRFPGED